jgi:type VI secretion system protein VasD
MNSAGIRLLVRLVVASVLTHGLVSCGSTPPTPQQSQQTPVLSISATSDVNPDTEGRPSPIVLQVLELSTDVEFDRADYFSLTNEAQSGLGGTVLRSMEFVLTPGSTKTSPLELNERTTHLGFVAGYRDIDHSRWRLSLPVVTGETQSISISLNKQNISINNLSH